MKRLALLVACTALTACAVNPPAANPDVVTLNSTRMTVLFTDGTNCRVDLAAGRSGTLPDCPHPLRYEVEVQRANPLAPLLGDLVAPYALIALSDGAGRTWRYRSPASRDWTFGEGRDD